MDCVELVGVVEVIILQPVLAVEEATDPAELIELPKE